MTCIKKLILCSFLIGSLPSHAGIWATTIHSRANCGNNESITWYANHYYYWRVYSFHWYDMKNSDKGYHLIDTGMTETWRQAAVHWGESGPTGNYLVHGNHYYLYNGKQLLDNTTDATDCSIYDGWWD